MDKRDKSLKNNKDNKDNYEILYIKLCSKETVDYINCVHNEPYGFKCNKQKLLNLFLECQKKLTDEINNNMK